MFEDGFQMSTMCDEDKGHHVYPDICKCEYNKGKEVNDITIKALVGEVDNRIQLEKRLKQINEIAIRSLDKWNDGYIDHNGYKEIKELSDV